MTLSIKLTEFSRLLVVIAFGLFLSAQAGALPVIPAYSAPVVDQTGTLSAKQLSDLSERLLTFSHSAQNQGMQIAVLMINSLEGEAIEQYASRVFEQWKIGRKSLDNGVLLVIAKNDHKVRIEVGYGQEGLLPDLLVKRIINSAIIPAFKQDDYYQGISQAVTQLINYIEQPTTQTQQTDSDITNDGEVEDRLFSYAMGSFVVCFILSRLSPRLIPTIKGEQGLQNFFTGILNSISIGIFGLINGFALSSLLPFLFLALVASTIFAAILTGRMRGGRVSSRSPRGGGRFGGSGRGGGGFSGGGGGRSGGGGASGSW